MKPLESKGLVLPFSPGRLISLADMVRFVISTYLNAEATTDWKLQYYSKEAVSGTGRWAIWTSLPGTKRSEVLSEKEALELYHKLECDVRPICVQLGLVVSTAALNRLGDVLRYDGDCHHLKVYSGLESLLSALADEVRQHSFAFIPANKVQFFEQDALLGKAVYDNFPSARQDIKQAGNCLASDLNTAAVFHFMRAAEYAMRALAKRVKIKTKHPLEYCDWSQVITETEKKLAKIKLKPRGKKKTELWEAYSRTVSDCKALIESRNRVSHARGEFSEAEALGVFNRAKDLMQHLSRVISEI